MDEEQNREYLELRKAASTFRTTGEHEKAANTYLKARQLSAASDSGLYAAMCLRDAGLFDQAREEFERYTKDKPTDVRGWVVMGTFLKQQKDYANAVRPLQVALALQQDVTVRNTYISVLWRLGQYDQARTEGLKNLQEKQTNAFKNFQASPFKEYKLVEGRRGFNPEKRECNVISFSLWGDKPEYITGALINAQIAQHIYVRWTPRFYCDNSVPADALAALKAYGAQVVMLNNPNYAKFRPMWRFLVADDPSVNVFVCRDADSRLNVKELLAVQDWLNSGKRFHVMRDHIYHHELILAGMWGGTCGVLPNMEDWLNKASTYFDNKFGDQAFLADMIWPLIYADTQIHDSEYRFPNGSSFPPGYDLPGLIHVGGSVKQMPHWSKYVQMPRPQ